MLRLVFRRDRYPDRPLNPVKPTAVIYVCDDAAHQQPDHQADPVINNAWDKPASGAR